MPSSQDCRSRFDCIFMIKTITTRSLLFCQIMRNNVESDEPRGIVRRRPQPAMACQHARRDELHLFIAYDSTEINWALRGFVWACRPMKTPAY